MDFVESLNVFNSKDSRTVAVDNGEFDKWCKNFQSSLSVDEMIQVIDTMRKFCNGDIRVAQSICTHMVLVKIFDYVQNLTEATESIDDVKKIKVLAVSLKMTCNFVSSGSHFAVYFWEIRNNMEHIRDLVAASAMFRDRECVGLIIHVVFVCVKDDSALLMKFIDCRPLLCQILLTLMLESSHPGPALSSISSTEDNLSEWSKVLVYFLTSKHLLHKVFERVAPTQSRAGFNSNFEQLILLQLSIMIIEDSYFTKQLLQIENFFTVEDGIVSYLFYVTELLCSIDNYTLKSLNITNNDENSSVLTDNNKKIDNIITELGNIEHVINDIDNAMNKEIIISYVVLSLQLIASTLAIAPKDAGYCLRMKLTQETNIIVLCANIIYNRHVGARVGGNKSYATNSNNNADGNNNNDSKKLQEQQLLQNNNEETEETIKLLVQYSLQLLGNLVYGCNSAQNRTREVGGLSQILSHCVTDFHNPMAREWALLCTRNLCEDNIENQAFISQLQPQGIEITNEKMREQGLKVEMDTTTGKFKFIQQQQQQHHQQEEEKDR